MPKLTDTSIRAAEPPKRGQRTITDDALPNFGVRLSQGGTKTFIVTLGRGRRHTIGRYPLISLADARKEARRILAEKELGKVRPTYVSWESATVAYLERCERENRALTIRDYRRILTKRFPFGTRALADVQARDIRAKLDGLPPQEKHHAFTACRSFLRWCVREHYIDQAPTDRMETPPQNKPRERVLTDDEIRALWGATSPVTSFNVIVRLLIATGQRRGEIARLERSWIDDTERTVTIPAAVTKNGRTHTFPYGDLTCDLFMHVQKMVECPYLFPASRQRSEATTVFNGWSKAKARLDRDTGVTDWTLHDLRRTYSSTMARLGVPQIVVEKLLNHVSGGTQSPIAQTYNRYSYLSEMRDAVERYDQHIRLLVS